MHVISFISFLVGRVRLAAGEPSRRIAYDANLGHYLQAVKQNVQNAQQMPNKLAYFGCDMRNAH
jgi:hypothetical protein